ncbi:MAG: radical SAM protein [bacterium]
MSGEPARYIIKLGYECNNNCVFCHAVANRARRPLDLRRIEKKILMCREKKPGTVIVSGGEPTIRKDFPSVAELVLRSGMRFGLITNGRMFAYGDFADAYAGLDPEYTYVSIHGPDRKTHDAATRAPSFHQVVAGIGNLRGRVANLTLNVVITSLNVGRLSRMVDLALGVAAPCRLKFSLPEPKGAARARGGMFPDALEAAAAVKKALEYASGRGAKSRGVSLRCDGFTPCLIDDWNALRADLVTDNIGYMSETFEKELHPVDYGEREFVNDECLKCREYINCPGIYAGYLLRSSRRIAKAITRPKSNGIMFTPLRVVRKAGEKDCPGGKERMKELDRRRDLAMICGNRLKIYTTRTGDFGEDVIRMIKLDKGQVYLDNSKGGKNTDFRRDHRKLALHEQCGRCRSVSDCAGVFAPVRGDVYKEQRRSELEIIKGMKGRVLDVGCGLPHFADLLRTKIARGEIDYLGVDLNPPDAPGLKMVKGTMESFVWDGRPFDHVLVLRSFNHFEDPDAVFSKITKMLRHGGRLLIVENSVYIILKEGGDAGKPGAERFEHFRNMFSDEALMFLNAVHPFRTALHIPITPEGPNQWMLLLEKTGGNRREGKDGYKARRGRNTASLSGLQNRAFARDALGK